MLGGHGKYICSCGALIRQCRCPHNDPPVVVTNGCEQCKAPVPPIPPIPVVYGALTDTGTVKGLPYDDAAWSKTAKEAARIAQALERTGNTHLVAVFLEVAHRVRQAQEAINRIHDMQGIDPAHFDATQTVYPNDAFACFGKEGGYGDGN